MEPPYVDTVFWGKNDQRCDEVVTADPKAHITEIDNRVTNAHSTLLAFGVIVSFATLLSLLLAWRMGLLAFVMAVFVTFVVTTQWAIPLAKRQFDRYTAWTAKRLERTVQFQRLNLF